MVSRVWMRASTACRGGRGAVTTSYCPGAASAWYICNSTLDDLRAFAISSRTWASLVPEASAGEFDHPWELTGSIGFVLFSKINSVSNPTRNPTPEICLALLNKGKSVASSYPNWEIWPRTQRAFLEWFLDTSQLRLMDDLVGNQQAFSPRTNPWYLHVQEHMDISESTINQEHKDNHPSLWEFNNQQSSIRIITKKYKSCLFFFFFLHTRIHLR